MHPDIFTLNQTKFYLWSETSRFGIGIELALSTDLVSGPLIFLIFVVGFQFCIPLTVGVRITFLPIPFSPRINLGLKLEKKPR